MKCEARHATIRFDYYFSKAWFFDFIYKNFLKDSSKIKFLKILISTLLEKMGDPPTKNEAKVIPFIFCCKILVSRYILSKRFISS